MIAATTTLGLVGLLACGSPEPTPATAEAPSDDGRTGGRGGKKARQPVAPDAHPGRPDPERPPAARGAGPDLLFVTWDTIRADHVGAWGYFRDTTPFLDTLARDHVMFERFIVPMATTLPSHTSMFTGVRPEEHGIVANVAVTGERFVPSEQLRTLAGFLADEGWTTGAFVSSTPLKAWAGLSVGFDHYDEPRRDHRRGGDTVKRALAWLGEQPTDRPVFLWVHLYDPHYPYQPPAGWRKLWDDEDALLEHLEALSFPGLEKKMKRRRDRATEALIERFSGYDGDIRYTDDTTRELVEGWDAARGADTPLVVAGDHGEGLGQHHHLEHGLTWHEQLHSPLVMRLPGRPARRVATTTGANDILPTLLGAVDLPHESELLAQVTGADVLADDYVPEPVLSRSSERHIVRGRALRFSLTDGRWKVISHDGEAILLFDLEVDPHEQHDVAAEHPDVVQRYRRLGRDMLQEQQAMAARIGAGEKAALDEDMLGELKAIGYME